MNEQINKLKKRALAIEKKIRIIIGGKEAVEFNMNKRYLNLREEIYQFVESALKTVTPDISFSDYEWISQIVLIMESYLQIHFMDYKEWTIPRWSKLEKEDIILSISQIGKIEGGLEDLERVFIVCDRVEAPKNGLRLAVEKRFSQGVVYTFLVSKSNAEQEVDGYFQLFKTIAEISIKKYNSIFNAEDLVKIKQLDFEWNQNPCIFYFQNAKNGSVNVIGFQGVEEKKAGISKNYKLVPENIARLCIQAIRSQAPKEVFDYQIDQLDIQYEIGEDSFSKIVNLNKDYFQEIKHGKAIN